MKFYFLKEKKMNRNGCLLPLDMTIDDQNFVLVNLYNANTEKNQLNAFNELSEMLKSVNNISPK